MRCFAQYIKSGELEFREHTLLQFGKCWDVVYNVLLLNPGSAKPLSDKVQNELLQSNNVSVRDGEYVEFSIDPLMRSLVEFFKQKFPNGGIVKIYNLFNLRNPQSVTALNIFRKYMDMPHMTTPEETIDYCDQPLLIATGGGVYKHERLGEELKKYFSLAKDIYALQKVDEKTFAPVVVKKVEEAMESYHPSYTFKYGNRTIWK